MPRGNRPWKIVQQGDAAGDLGRSPQKNDWHVIRIGADCSKVGNGTQRGTGISLKRGLSGSSTVKSRRTLPISPLGPCCSRRDLLDRAKARRCDGESRTAAETWCPKPSFFTHGDSEKLSGEPPKHPTRHRTNTPWRVASREGMRGCSAPTHYGETAKA